MNHGGAIKGGEMKKKIYTLFSPLIGDDGDQVVRIVGKQEWADLGYPVAYDDLTRKEREKKHPILTMREFEEDPLGEIRKVFEEFKEPGFFEDRKLAEYRMKQAIVKTMERVEGK